MSAGRVRVRKGRVITLLAVGALGVMVGRATAAADLAVLPLPWDMTAGSGAGAVDRPADPGQLLPEVVEAYERADEAAAQAGIELTITSGYRSPEYQQQLFDEAIAKYGSAEAARHWVLPPDESSHVQGIAIDVGPAEGADWLHAHGAAFGFCKAYENEWWHFEYRPEWIVDGACSPPAPTPGG